MEKKIVKIDDFDIELTKILNPPESRFQPMLVQVMAILPYKLAIYGDDYDEVVVTEFLIIYQSQPMPQPQFIQPNQMNH